jgi:protein involved in polysaccharide export with SLBB domain
MPAHEDEPQEGQSGLQSQPNREIRHSITEHQTMNKPISATLLALFVTCPSMVALAQSDTRPSTGDEKGSDSGISRVNTPTDGTAVPLPKSEPKQAAEKVSLKTKSQAGSVVAPTDASARISTEANPSTPGVATSEPLSSDQRLTEIYRVGVGDVLDIRLLNSTNNRSTLFTVINGGLIDLPVAGGPISVAGLTPEEIQNRITAELKRRAIEDGAQVSVGVRQFVSHSVVLTGLVSVPGTRFLRREAVPLYVILAESQLHNDAGRVVIIRAGITGPALDLTDPATLNVTVRSGDVIAISVRPEEFYYIAGRINYPGQKSFQRGITLLQAILAGGGTPKNESLIEISREGPGGMLVTTRFDMREIKAGRMADPKLLAGDRIEVLK